MPPETKDNSLFLLMVTHLFVSSRGGLLAPILSLFIRRQGMTITQVGLLGTASVLGWLIFEPICGILADRGDKKRMMIFALVATTVLYALFPRAKSFTHFAGLQFLITAAMSTYSISFKSLQAEFLPAEKRGEAYGRFLSVISFGGVIAPFLGGWLTENYGYNTAFYLAAATGLLGTVFITRMKVVRNTASPLDVSGLRAVLSAPLMSIYTVRSLYFFNNIFRANFLPIYLNESPRYNATEAQIGLYITLVSVAVSVGQATMGRLIDRYGERRMIAMSVFLVAVSYVGLSTGSGIPLLMGIGLFQGLSMALGNMGMMMHLMSIIPEGRTGMVMGLYSEAENIGGMVTNPTIGYLYESFGSDASIQVLVAVLVFTAAVSLLLLKEKKPQGE